MVAYLALFVALGTGGAWAAATIGSGDIKRNAVKSRHIDNGHVHSPDIGANAVGSAKVADDTTPRALGGIDIANDSLGASDIDESSLGFIASNVYKAESAVGAGTTLGDGTQYIDQACNPGDVLLSGGPANINSTTDLLESFPAPGSTNTWRARVNKNAVTDNFSVLALCADQ